MRTYNFETKAFTSFEVDNFKPNAFVMADGAPPALKALLIPSGHFVCYTGSILYCCSTPSLKDRTSLFRCTMEANLPPFVSILHIL